MHVCPCMWKFYHLSCVLVSVVPDLRAGLMGTYSSNVGLLLIASQNSLPKKNIHPSFKGQSCFPRGVHGVYVCKSCVYVCGNMLTGAALGPAAASQAQQQKPSDAGLYKVIYHAGKTSHGCREQKKKEKIRKKLDFSPSGFPHEEQILGHTLRKLHNSRERSEQLCSWVQGQEASMQLN